ncbi:MAG: helix-turn-helix transcriptional regulator, partial [Opitutaceae bacterium]|nr:helix-turn-helix transcriptional regulator [Opitutaceae bacterium]
MRANLDKKLAIADLARHTGYSVSYLRAIFRREIGVSLGSYMRDSRLSMAASMLSAPGHGSIEEIARSCGFNSLFAFSRAFKTAMGMPPTAYLKFLQSGHPPPPTPPPPPRRAPGQTWGGGARGPRAAGG